MGAKSAPANLKKAKTAHNKVKKATLSPASPAEVVD